MIRPVDTSLLDAVAKTTPPAPAQADAAAASGKNAFAAQLKRAAKTAADSDATTSETKPADTADTRTAARVTPPTDEKWRPVKGHDDYAEIIDGDRKGQFVNLNRGARRGEAFTIEERDGKTVHVYKKDDGTELAIEVQDSKEARAAGTRKGDREPPKGETWAPVKDHMSYADILSGPRNGYFVNIQQGSAREGDVFHIVKRGGKEFHVYGDGKDAVYVEVGAKKKKADSTTSANGTSTQSTSGAADTRDATQSTTGGAAATSSTPATT